MPSIDSATTASQASPRREKQINIRGNREGVFKFMLRVTQASGVWVIKEGGRHAFPHASRPGYRWLYYLCRLLIDYKIPHQHAVQQYTREAFAHSVNV